MDTAANIIVNIIVEWDICLFKTYLFPNFNVYNTGCLINLGV